MRYLALVFPLCAIVVGCSENESRLQAIRDVAEGCYSSPDFPIAEIADGAVTFGGETISTDIEFGGAGRSPDTLISIRPRLYLTQRENGAWAYEVEPRLRELGESQGKDYSAQWALIPEGEEGQRLDLIFVGKPNLGLTRVECP